MKYMIVNLIKGEPAHYQKNLSDEIAHVFSLEEISRRIPPHLTLKAPFESRDVRDVQKVLEQFCAHHKSTPLTYEGFGNFDRRVIFMDAKPSAEAATLINELTGELKKIPWLRFDQREERVGHEKRLHATLAYAETRKLFDEIWKYVSDEKARYEATLDNIAILERGKDKWNIHAEYTLQ